MSEDMLGKVSLSETRGPRMDLDEKLAGLNGQKWLRAIKRMLRGENPWGVPRFFSITTDGRDGEQSIACLEGQGCFIHALAKKLLRGSRFVATNGVTYHLAVVSGDELENKERTNENIRALAAKRRYLEPPLELAPYVREMFSDEDLASIGLHWLILMHQPIVDQFGRSEALGFMRSYKGSNPSLETHHGEPDFRWNMESWFLFLEPEEPIFGSIVRG